MDDNLYVEFQQQLDRHPLGQIECWGALGHGYPGSLFKLFIRFTDQGRWWHCESTIDHYPVDRDPRRMYDRVPANRCALVAGRLELLGTLSCHTQSAELVAALASVHRRLDAERRGRRVLDRAPRGALNGATTRQAWMAWRDTLSDKTRRLVDWLVFLDRAELAARPELGDACGLLGGADIPSTPSWRARGPKPDGRAIPPTERTD